MPAKSVEYLSIKHKSNPLSLEWNQHMAANWRKKANPSLILQKFEKIVSINNDGRLQFTGFEFFEYEAQLHGIIDFGEQLSFGTKKRLRDRALLACVKAKKLTSEIFIKNLNKEISIFNNEKNGDFLFVTSLSISDGLPTSRFKFQNSEIYSFKSALPKKYKERDMHNAHWERIFKDKSPLPENYTAVVVKIKAKTPEDAVETALNNLDLARGLLALNINPSLQFSLGSTQSNKPINKILLGGMHSLHKPNGQIINKNNFWYESNYNQPDPVNLDKKARKAVSSNIKFQLSKLNKYPKEDQETIQNSIIRYVRAIDESDKNTVIQKLWSTLESLLCKNERDCDKIASRCSYIFTERDYVAQIIETIRDYRNRSVHSGIVEEGIDSYCYQLQRFLKAVLFFYLSRADFFENLDEANHFLDSPVSEEKIRKDIKASERRAILLKEAISFRHPR